MFVIVYAASWCARPIAETVSFLEVRAGRSRWGGWARMSAISVAGSPGSQILRSFSSRAARPAPGPAGSGNDPPQNWLP